MTAPYANWLQRANDVGCFPTPEDAVDYLIGWLDSEVQLVREVLLDIFTSRRFNTEILSWTARPDEYAAACRSCDAPAVLTGMAESSMALVTFAGTRLQPSEFLTPAGAVDGAQVLLMLSELGASFALAEVGEKPDLALALQNEVLSTVGEAPLPIGRLVRAYVAALFLQKTAHSAQLRRSAPQAQIAGSLADGLLVRANGAGLAWAGTYGPSAKLLPIDAIARATSVTQVDALLARVHTRPVNNLVNLLRCKPDAHGGAGVLTLLMTVQ